MIERVAGCLEHGGNKLLKIASRATRARRSLHSTFWSHGAGSIDLPAWWTLFLQSNEGRAPEIEKAQNDPSSPKTTGLHRAVLSFLYPMQTQALISRIQSSTNAHREATRTAQRYSRRYTSAAANLIDGKPLEVTSELTSLGIPTEQERSISPLQIHLDTARAILKRRVYEPEECDQLWRIQNELLESDDTQNSRNNQYLRLIQLYLSKSNRAIDLERSLAMFEALEGRSLAATQYKRAINAALSLGDLVTATAVHDKALIKFPQSEKVGTNLILAYAVVRADWQVAIDTWYASWQVPLYYRSTRQYLWSKVKALPMNIFIRHTLAATQFATKIAKSATEETAFAARQFSIELFGRILEVQGAHFNMVAFEELLILMRRFGVDIAVQTNRALIQRMRGKGRGNEAGPTLECLHFYRKVSHATSFIPQEGLLWNLLKGLCKMQDVAGITAIRHDYRKYGYEMQVKGYSRMADALARSGDIDALNRLIDDFENDCANGSVSSIGHRINNPSCVSSTDLRSVLKSMLYVHMARADTEGVIQTFHKLQSQYGFEHDVGTYKLVIMTFERVGDVEGAISWYEKLLEAGLTPDTSVFGNLMHMYAKRGDVDAVGELLEELRSFGLVPDINMIDALVTLHVKDEDLVQAESIVMQALNMDLIGSKTSMWNRLIHGYAETRDLRKVAELHDRMKQHGIREDDRTYAALLRSFCYIKMPSRARSIMQKVMPRRNIRPTAEHFTTVMWGFCATREYSLAFQTYKDMIDIGIVPTANAHNVMLRAAVRMDQAEGAEGAQSLLRAREVLDMATTEMTRANVARADNQQLSLQGSLNPLEKYSAGHYEYMIFSLGQEGAYDEATEMFDRYLTNAQILGIKGVEDSPPLMMVSALLTTHRRAGNHEEAERCWSLLLEKLIPITAKKGADLREPGWVLPSRRFLINPALTQYMQQFEATNRVHDLVNLVQDLRLAGYELHSVNWNAYIQILARSATTQHQYLSFELCEKELIASWPGWEALTRSTTNVIRKRAAIGRLNKDTNLLTFKRYPTYRTIVQLAAVYADASATTRDSAAVVGRAALATMAPKTTQMVMELPVINDEIQPALLQKG